MMEDAYFRQWVANTVLDVMGICGLNWRDIAGECALTYADSRTGACQWVLHDYFDQQNRALTHAAGVVLTNKPLLH